ncbi:hypothetical protein TREMEDRAFT_59115 [Tremella mesenterica DSM 1558]|uniref:uncharacterized protein n=1 Tax=Tremella mesenterica (strain ATCC 24925 / CBS 8224 / DSM 1558 / NBRC 9311 / NRRL Y-6157 / RJB 2259-6 / UBC 559-6) TaxID=578456 RepID=UPI0003F49B12|nr:uncharacterized protein TREMEDRAFT_59115 [Tremella mesenterica DSM 1558]EIW72956.1 hypothetical protein TREMEDRAFT_59115 [Tremella mesenterica DSM 1558]
MSTSKLRVAVVGAGPGGLASTIFLSRLPFVELSVFEKARELREIGAGITLNQNTWRLLRLLEATDVLGEEYSTRGDASVVDQQHRNGLSGKLLLEKHQSSKLYNPCFIDVFVDPDTPAKSRVKRYKLQSALLSKIPPGKIQLCKGLSRVDEISGELFLEFQDGTREGPFDLLIGADGIRSSYGEVRQHAFPKHHIGYTGKVAYRALLPQSSVAHIPNLPQVSNWWWMPDARVFTVGLGDQFEIAVWVSESEEEGGKVSWGQKAGKEKVLRHCESFCETVRAIISIPETWLEFSMFGGPRLERVIEGEKIALVGDASHPLSGAFGAGAAFAFEDAYILFSAIQHAWDNGQTLSEALENFDSVRAPFYERIFSVIDLMASNYSSALKQGTDLEDKVSRIVDQNWKDLETSWIYEYDVCFILPFFINSPGDHSSLILLVTILHPSDQSPLLES